MESKLEKLTQNDAIIIVDVQNDFCPGGALSVEEGDSVVPVLNKWLSVKSEVRPFIAASRDWHPHNHISFLERGGAWPPHCIQNSIGAMFHPELQLPEDIWIVSKGTDPNRDQYSAFDGTGFADHLYKSGIKRLWIGGLALDVCVKATVLDALKAGFEVHVIEDAARAVNIRPRDGEKAIREMVEAGAFLVKG